MTSRAPNPPNLPPGIDDYLEKLDDLKAVKIDGLDDLLEEILVKTKLNPIEAKIVLQRFFQEIRNSMLRDRLVIIRGLGTFNVQSPKTTGTKKKIFASFKPSPSLKKRLNGKK